MCDYFRGDCVPLSGRKNPRTNYLLTSYVLQENTRENGGPAVLKISSFVAGDNYAPDLTGAPFCVHSV